MIRAGAAGASAFSASAVAVAVATDIEGRTVRRGIRKAARAGTSAARIDCIGCGIGCRVHDALDGLARYGCVISCGFAAGLAADLTAGTRLLPNQVLDEQGRTHVVSREWHARLRRGLMRSASSEPVRTEPLIHTGNVLRSPADKRALGGLRNAVAADMESALIAAACSSQQVPFVALRIVLDPVDAGVPEAVAAAAEGGGEPDAWRLLRELVRRPYDCTGILPLAAYTLTARRALESAVTQVAAVIGQW